MILLHLTITPLSNSQMFSFLKGSFLIIVGLTFFLHGMDIGIMPIGSFLGSSLIRSKKVFFILLSGGVIAFLVAVAEPNLLILGKQVEENVLGLSAISLLIVASIGLALAIILSLARTIFQLPFKLIILLVYGLIFVLSAFVSPLYVSIALDTGGAITGPLTVPFIISFGVGSASVRSDVAAHDDNFGYTGMAVASPILLVLIYAVITKFLHGANIAPLENVLDKANTFSPQLLDLLPSTMWTVFLSILPLVLLLLVFQFLLLHIPPEALRKIIVGFVYSYIGLCFFFLGTNTAFIPIAEILGKLLACLSFNWIALPIAFIIGGTVVCSEPSAWALIAQVEEISEGNIRTPIMLLALALGTSFFVALAIAKILFNFSIWYLIIPSYLLIFILTLLTPPLFSAIAFDSGSVASGPISSAFVLPLALGFSSQFSSGSASNAFGLIAMTSLSPLITIQILGCMFEGKKRRALRKTEIEKRRKETE
ncbi:MAG: DUF1538 domain-containing protein [Treponema sp.]